MQQVIQSVRTGELQIVTLPSPAAQPGHVLIVNRRSLVSAGTERMVRELARKSLLGKARERPDHVHRVLEKVRDEGLVSTVRQVREKLDEPMPLGYCSAGVVIACGQGVQEFKPGDWVASNGPHAEVVCVPKHLCARIPEGVPHDQAAFTVVGAIALQGLRLARLSLGETAFVIGLGLVGQITVALLNAAGIRVIGTDLDAAKCTLATRMGADVARTEIEAQDVTSLTGGLGADVVFITASTPSDEPVRLAGEAVRQKGRVVAVGAVGMNLPRRPYYFKEAEFVVSCSYGPGRYDTSYEELGHDYPPAYVRWTEQRNMQALLDQLSAGRVDFSPLISHRFSIDRAAEAYDLIENGREPYLGILLEYPLHSQATLTRQLELKSSAASREGIGIGCLGAGSFARSVLLPKLCTLRGVRSEMVCSAGAISAAHAGRRLGFAAATSDERDVLDHPAIDAVFIVTRHDQHARQVIAAVRAGKHVFVEKPLCLTVEELVDIEAEILRAHETLLVMVGFNRRFSPAVQAVRSFFATTRAPLTVSVRMNVGAIPADHWTQDEQIGGGRILGEACHAIDLATCLVGSPAVRVYAESIGGPTAPNVTDDQSFITLRHANGSVSSVAYLAGGDKAYPKERVEVIGDGKVAVIDDFRLAEGCCGGKRRKLWRGSQDKGHQEELHTFVQTILHGGTAPIPWAELRATTLASILEVQSLREGRPIEIPNLVSRIDDQTALLQRAG